MAIVAMVVDCFGQEYYWAQYPAIPLCGFEDLRKAIEIAEPMIFKYKYNAPGRPPEAAVVGISCCPIPYVHSAAALLLLLHKYTAVQPDQPRPSPHSPAPVCICAGTGDPQG